MKLRYKIVNGILIFLALAFLAIGILLSHTSACEPAPTLASGVQSMKAAIYRCYGSPDVVAVENVAKPALADDHVLVRVKAASVNPLDWHYMRGSPYFMRLSSGIGKPADTRLGVDFAGTIEAVGDKVTMFNVGDEVFGGAAGAFGQYLVIGEDRGITPKPANVSFEQAAAVPIAGVTALQALVDEGDLKPGQKVLINGASGGVGTFAVQIAKSMGAEVYGVCSTRNVEMVKSLGADHVFDYKKEDYTESGEQFDLIVDMISNHSLAKNRGVLKPDGTMVIVGGAKGNWIGPVMGPLKAMMLSPFIDQKVGMILAHMRQDDLATLAALMEAGSVTPVIDRSFPLTDIAEAIRYSESGRARGKIIVDIP